MSPPITKAPAVQGAELTATDVALNYHSARGDVMALRGLSLSVGPGEFVCVLGPSGCGKSTLLRLASGLMPPSSGELRLNGTVIRKPRPDVGIVFQKPTLLPWKTVLDNVLAPLRVMGRNVREQRDHAIALLRLVGLEEFPNHYPNELSGGMQQRVSLARGLIHDPALLLMDEPFAALDAMTRELMMVELQRIWMAAGKSVLFITHSIPEAIFLADRVLVMSGRPGRVVHELRVAFARPRSLDLLGTPEFAELSHSLRKSFQAL